MAYITLYYATGHTYHHTDKNDCKKPGVWPHMPGLKGLNKAFQFISKFLQTI